MRKFLGKIKQFLLDLIDPHRRYMGQQVYRTTVFWTTVIYSFLSVMAYRFAGFKAVIAFLLIMHILDFAAYIVEQRYFNFNPMKGTVGRRED